MMLRRGRRTCHGIESTCFRWTSVWRPPEIRRGISPICARVSSNMPNCHPGTSMPCPSRHSIWRLPPAGNSTGSPPDRRIAAGARPRPSRSRTRRSHGFPCARRSCSEHRRSGCCSDRRLRGKAPHDVDLPDRQSLAAGRWVVTGAEKVEVLNRLRDGDLSIPAGRVRGETSRCSPTQPPPGSSRRGNRQLTRRSRA